MGYRMKRNAESPFDFGEGTGSPLNMEYNEDVARAGTNVQQMIQGTPNRSEPPTTDGGGGGGGWDAFHSATADRVSERRERRKEKRAKREEIRKENVENVGWGGFGGRIN